MAEHKYQWEDFEVGQVRDLGTISPTREEIIQFATQFDPQPFHLDDEAAKASVFGGLCASGWHTCSMAMRLMVTRFLQETSSLGSPGLEDIKWPKPVFPGDVLRLRVTVLDSRISKSNPSLGILRWRWQLHNVVDTEVLDLEVTSLFDLSGAPK